MICRDFILLLQDIAERRTLKQSKDCFLKPPCGCPQPGKLLQCEDCQYLEACLSDLKTQRASGRSTNAS